MKIAQGVDICKDLLGTTTLEVHTRAHECRKWLEKKGLYTHAELPTGAFKVGQRHYKDAVYEELLRAVCAKLGTPASIERTQTEIVYKFQYQDHVDYLNNLKIVYEIGIYRIFLGLDSP